MQFTFSLSMHDCAANTSIVSACVCMRMCEGLDNLTQGQCLSSKPSTQFSLPDPDGSPPASSRHSLVLVSRPRSLPAHSRTPLCHGGRASNAHICSKSEEKQRERWRDEREGGGY